MSTKRNNSDTEDGDPCLLCLRPGISLEAAISPDHLSCNDAVGGNSDLIKPHVISIFVLRRLLSFPKLKCNRFLKRGRLEPGSWFYLCKACSVLVAQGLDFQQKILEFTAKLGEIKKKLRKGLEQALEKEEPPHCENEEVELFYQGVRQFYGPATTSENGDADDEEPSPSYSPIRPRSPSSSASEFAVPSSPASSEGSSGGKGSDSESGGEESKRRSPRRPRKESRAKKTEAKRGRRTAAAKGVTKRRRMASDYESDDSDGGTSRNDRLECRHCGGDYSSQKSLAQHIRMVHDDGERRKFKCVECDVTFDRTTRYEDHMAKHAQKGKQVVAKASKLTESTLEGVVKCGLCRKELSSRTEYYKHLRTVHKKRYAFNCDQCEATYRRKWSLDDHVAQKHGKGPKGKADDKEKGSGDEENRENDKNDDEKESDDYKGSDEEESDEN